MSRRRAVWTAVKVVGALVLAGMLYLAIRHIGPGNVVAAMRRAKPRSIAVAAAGTFVVFLLWCVRWTQMMPRRERRSLLRIFPIYMAGVFGNVVTPGARVGGEPIRAYYMSRAFGGEKTAYLGTIIADKVGYLLVFTGFLILSVLFVVVVVPIGRVYRLLLGGAVVLVALAILSGALLKEQIGRGSPLLRRVLPVLYHGKHMAALRRLFPTYRHFEDYCVGKLDNLVRPLVQAAGSPRAVAKAIAISTASWLLMCLAHQVVFAGLGLRLDFPRVVVIVTIATFVGDLCMSPGGAGAMEAAMVALCAAFGVPYDTAAAVTVISRGIYYVLGIGLGGVCLAALAARYGRSSDHTGGKTGAADSAGPARPGAS
jgi:uncharacterized protein (TIRG00374 family)